MSLSNLPETLHVENIDHFIQILCAWHETKVKQLSQMLEVPEGIEVKINDDPPFILEGDRHKGFLMGLSMALMELGQLPFVAEVDETESIPTDEPVQH